MKFHVAKLPGAKGLPHITRLSSLVSPKRLSGKQQQTWSKTQYDQTDLGKNPHKRLTKFFKEDGSKLWNQFEIPLIWAENIDIYKTAAKSTLVAEH